MSENEDDWESGSFAPVYHPLSEPPTRLCCGEKHYGPKCPDGKVMCCLCFSRFDIKDLHVYSKSGKPEDVCMQCAQEEKAMCIKLGKPHPDL